MNLGIYIQIPFCQTKCTYCNFHTGVVSRDRYEPYAIAICREIAVTAATQLRGGENTLGVAPAAFRPTNFLPASSLLGGRSFSSDNKPLSTNGALAPDASVPIVDTIYFGGGTPSLLAPSALARILDTLGGTYRSDASEITLEADPETITDDKAVAWRAAGFNRISLGVQSFQRPRTPSHWPHAPPRRY